ncbi:class I SAM-dependent methyltransferase [Mucilaginibacter conchicola]|uniref:Class I SAM-dependent methyltransferase n=1 Tax=Mucilaginibacter conchicola TaxID=2303333 RepID=A0A372NZP0_9SPHI|nr:class I SAM-dependent methyltransferase [Mucilaginibacter conchicola]RFZ95595.1 class I SAM-dependent methyltransferase [Mucilaginibacter conchicola]
MYGFFKSVLKKALNLSTPLTVGTKNEETRNNWIKNTLVKIPAGGRILDAGAGEQPYKVFCEHLSYVSQDFDQYNAGGDGVGLQRPSWDYGKLDIICDIASVPEADNSFDAIMCTEVFEHIRHPREAVKEFTRLLKPGGYLILTAPFASLTHFAPYHFYSGFNSFFYREELEEAGFDILEMEANGNFFEFLAQEINRISGVAASYSKDSLSLKEKLASKVLLKALQRFSGKDKGSSELLNMGFHVLARKK